MVRAHLLSFPALPGGRKPKTEAEREVAQALVRHGAARSQLGEAVAAERKAWSDLLGTMARHDPVDPKMVEALERFDVALEAKERAVAEVDAATAHFRRAVNAWACEASTSYVQPEACHG